MSVSKASIGTGKTMATGDTLRKLLRAHASDNDEAFRAAAFELIGHEREKNHRLLADDLERIVLSKAASGSRRYRVPDASASLPTVPRDRDRGLPLVRVESPELSWHRLVMPERDLKRLRRIADEHQRQGQLLASGLSPTRTVLFVGPPGTGKTLAARVLASVLSYQLFTVRFDAIVSSLLGETAANLGRVFEFIGSSRGVTLFDEFDAVAKERSDESEHGELKRVVNALLQLMDAYDGPSLLVAATNHQALLDSAVWRRFDIVVHFDLPSRQDRLVMLRRFLNGIRHDERALESAADSMAGASGADIQSVAMFAARSAILDLSDVVQAHHLRDAIAEFDLRTVSPRPEA